LREEKKNEAMNKRQKQTSQHVRLTKDLWIYILEFIPFSNFRKVCSTWNHLHKAVKKRKVLLKRVHHFFICAKKLGEALQQSNGAVIGGSSLLASFLNSKHNDIQHWFFPEDIDVYVTGGPNYIKAIDEIQNLPIYQYFWKLRLQLAEEKADPETNTEQAAWSPDYTPRNTTTPCGILAVRAWNIDPDLTNKLGIRRVQIIIVNCEPQQYVSTEYDWTCLANYWDGKHLVVNFCEEVDTKQLKMTPLFLTIRWPVLNQAGWEQVAKRLTKYTRRDFVVSPELAQQFVTAFCQGRLVAKQELVI
jgi:hypothetical protein